MDEVRPMSQFMLQLTEPLSQAVDKATEGQSRNAAIEGWLWRIKEVREAAKTLGLKRQPRRGRGRPAKDHN